MSEAFEFGSSALGRNPQVSIGILLSLTECNWYENITMKMYIFIPIVIVTIIHVIGTFRIL